MDTGACFDVVDAEYMGSVIEPPWINYARKWGPTINYIEASNVVEKLVLDKLKSSPENLVKNYYSYLEKEPVSSSLQLLLFPLSLCDSNEMGEEKPKPKPSGVWPTIKPFVNGGASGMLATCVIQPIDMIKVRIQLGQGSGVYVARTMLRDEGFGAFYKGLSAGLLRQATYTTARLGSFRILTNKAVAANDGKPLPLYQKALCGLTAGAIGASVGSPADLALIRMQADATLPLAQRRNYTNAFHALYRIVADEGVLALWKGAGPTVVRAMALNMGMLASYDQSVELFKDSLGFGEASTVVGASAVSGFFAAACSLPFDYVKTQIQKMQPDATGKYPYTGSLDCAMKTLKSGGPFKLYTGFPVYCIRIAPHVMMTWIFLNQIQKLEKSVGL
ncbi:mitochondrial dicarboxylate/tricarboxylate transporter DTC-like protein [Cinnamomum micranthum f. kanehirae]|uniref:Mitochondrial dicarboxylate/tricarboxylate transporter DTC-like protein n=1 Tax=Cinnamomum micranthum f. kanehirae TaxID=337451 RepID=A0A443N275_9MAGN|nr:mitochondrial dicarboxylate/tricarboxylate transporter DTC-like protein [Cinnamomum micranthum f. kanehirae]